MLERQRHGAPGWPGAAPRDASGYGGEEGMMRVDGATGIGVAIGDGCQANGDARGGLAVTGEVGEPCGDRRFSSGQGCDLHVDAPPHPMLPGAFVDGARAWCACRGTVKLGALQRHVQEGISDCLRMTRHWTSTRITGENSVFHK